MKHATLGTLDVGRIGLGAMGMSTAFTGAGKDDAESIRTIHRALSLGVTLLDTAEIYGPFTNEELVGEAIKGRRDDVVLATKFGMVSHAGGGPGHLDSSPANIRTAIDFIIFFALIFTSFSIWPPIGKFSGCFNNEWFLV